MAVYFLDRIRIFSINCKRPDRPLDRNRPRIKEQAAATAPAITSGMTAGMEPVVLTADFRCQKSGLEIKSASGIMTATIANDKQLLPTAANDLPLRLT